MFEYKKNIREKIENEVVFMNIIVYCVAQTTTAETKTFEPKGFIRLRIQNKYFLKR